VYFLWIPAPPVLATVGLVTLVTISLLATKPFIYKTPPITKTNPKIPGFAKKQQRLRKTRKVTASELEEIVNRLNTLTPAYKAKYSPNPHVKKLHFSFHNQNLLGIIFSV
jgi:pyruvate-formate lyase-activating enzyme